MLDNVKIKLRKWPGRSGASSAAELEQAAQREEAIQRHVQIQFDRMRAEEEHNRIVAEQQRRAREQQEAALVEQIRQDRSRRERAEHERAEQARAVNEQRERERVIRQREKQRVEKERVQIEKARHADKGRIRELREFIREKHRLDVEIWQQGIWLHRNAHLVEREEVQALCSRSDELMSWILVTVENWDEGQFKEAKEEWKMAKHIKDQLSAVKKKNKSWAEKPPWEYGRAERAERGPRHMYSNGTL